MQGRIVHCVLVLLAAQSASAADDLPQFRVPGFEREMDLLENLFSLHHSPRTTCTLWDAWLPMSTVWPAVGPPQTASAEEMRQFYKRSLSRRFLDADGYMQMNQHRGLAHPGGWPFPTWPQSRGRGWHFTHKGDGYAQMLKVPLAQSLDQFQLDGVESAAIDSGVGLRFRPAGKSSSIQTPPMSVEHGVAPFITIEWSRDKIAGDVWLEWTRDDAPNFSANRRMAVSNANARPGHSLAFSAVPVHRHPEWKGRITGLRLSWTNGPDPDSIVVRSIHTAIDSRHPITGSLFTQGVCDVFNWTGDVEFLRANISRVRKAMAYSRSEFDVEKNGCVVVSWIGHDGRTGFEFDATGSKHLKFGTGVGNNYWDLLPFGHKDFLATLYLYAALIDLSNLEATIAEHPEWRIEPATSTHNANALAQLAEHVRSRSQEVFWTEETGRFAACIDADGLAHDYGFTFLNLEAIYYGLASDQQARRIFAWIDGSRVVDGDTSVGNDIYHWRMAPRATTRRNVEWYGWYWHRPDSIPWGGQVQDGGAVLGFSYHDLMARLRIQSPDNTWKRLQEIIHWFDEVQQEGGYRAYYGKEGRGTLQGGGTAGGLGIDHEFMESILVPQVMLYGFLGAKPSFDHLRLDPRLPTGWPALTVTRIHFHDHLLDIRASHSEVEVVVERRGQRELQIKLPEDDRRRLVIRNSAAD